MKNYKGVFWKVVIGFAITGCLLGTAYYITFNNLDTLKKNLATLSEVNPKYVYRKEVMRKVDETESYVKKYTLNKNREYLYKCDSSISHIEKGMYHLVRLSSSNNEYYSLLIKLNSSINEKLSVARQRIELANAYSSGKEFSAAIRRIKVPEKKAILTEIEEKEQPQEKRNFFSRLFSRERNKNKPPVDTVLNASDKVDEVEMSAGYMKEMLQLAEQKETEKSNQYLKENLLLMDREDRIQDSIRSVSTALERLEVEESLVRINRLTEEATNKTANILSSLIITGLLVILLFIIVVYREVRFNERLRKELISEKQSTEKLAKAKEEFLANMSHEIRTPMNVIMGFSDQLLKTDLNNEQQKFLFNIKNSSRHLITVINEILDYSKMEAGAITLESIPFSVNEVIEDVYTAFKNQADKKNINFSYTIDQHVREKVIGDPVRLKQILLNLAGNAIKFTEKGMVEISCKEWTADDGAQTLLFEVHDTGIGIPQEAHNSIFQQFTQADSSVTRRYGGTGLGLAISKKLVDLHHGEIAVKSEPGKGSVFYFKITYLLPQENTMEQLSIIKELNTQILAGKRILIADDDEMNKYLAQHILESYNVDIDTANDGKEALEKILNENFDLVLMDLHMPEMGGVDVVKAIRQKGIDIKIIAITGNVLPSEREKCFKAGMNEYIAKPYDENELLIKIIDQFPAVY